MTRAALLLLGACALTSKSAPIELRYFTPPLATSAAGATGPGCARLELADVGASSHLRYRIAHRTSPVELDLYDTLRWTERPDQYARRALTRALFDRGRLGQALGGAGPVLDVELLGFEEVVAGAQHAGRVELRYTLHDETRVLARGTVAIERPASGAAIDPVVAAIGAALDAAADEVAARVTRELCPARLPGA